MAREAPILRLTADEFKHLQHLTHARSTPQGLAFRARLILRCAQPGIPRNDHVAAEFGCNPETVSRWRSRFRDHRLQGLYDLPRSGRPRTFSP
jgi:transposase